MIKKLKKIVRIINFSLDSIYGKKTSFDYTAKCINKTGKKENVRIGEHCCIRCVVRAVGEGKIIIGHHTYIGGSTVIGAMESVVIGNDVIISNEVHIYDNNNHPTSARLRKEMSRSNDFFGAKWQWDLADHSPVAIEDNVWIGERSTILKGVTIGRGSIVGCNSVVTHDVPEYSIVAGNPAKVVKTLRKDENNGKE